MSEVILMINHEDDGRSVFIPAGASVELHLPEEPASGLRWIEPTQTDVEILEDRYASVPDGGKGAGATRVFCLRPRFDHAVQLRFVLANKWEPDLPPEAVFQFELVGEEVR